MNATRAKRMLLDIGVGAIGVVVFWMPFTDGSTSSPAFRVVLLTTVVVGLLLREWMPVPGFILVLLATIVGTTTGVTHDPFVLAAWSLYPLAMTHGAIRPLRAVLGVLALLVFLGSVAVAPGAENTVRNGLFSFIMLAGSWALGSAARRARLEHEHAALAEQERAVTAERLHVAREVHDVLSHSLASIAVTSAVATHRADELTRGELVHRLAQVEATSQEALRDLKTVLGGIRSDLGDHPEPSATAPTRPHPDDLQAFPQPTMDDVPSLISRAVASGLRAELLTDGSARYSPTTELAVFRVVQEGLTNVAKHAPGSSCRVTVSAASEAVRVSVENSPPAVAVPPAPAGSDDLAFGLRGLNERVTQLGGTCESGHTAAGGFFLMATVPAHPTHATQPAAESAPS